MSSRARRLRALVFAAGVLSLVGTLAALLFGSRFSEPTPHPPDSYSRGPIGQRAFVETLDALGVHVVRFRSGRYDDVQVPLWFIEPDLRAAKRGRHKYDLAKIIAQRESHGRWTVVVLGKWKLDAGGTASAVADSTLTDVLDAAAPGARLAVAVAANDVPRPIVLRGSLGRFQVDVPRLQTLEPNARLIPLESAGARVVIGRVAGTHVLLVSDPDLLHNFDTQRADHAALALRLVRGELHSDTIAVDEVFHGHAELASLSAALGEYPAVLLPIQALALALLVAIAGFVRFGPSVPPAPARRAGPAAAVSVGGSVLAVGQPAWLLASSYVERALDELALHYNVTEVGARARAQRIDEIAERRGVAPRAVSLLDETAQLDPRRPAPFRALAVARAAWKFRRQLGNRRPAAPARKAA